MLFLYILTDLAEVEALEISDLGVSLANRDSASPFRNDPGVIDLSQRSEALVA